MAEKDLSVIIPLHNEEKNVPLLWSELCKALLGSGLRYEIIFVDDGSTDRTFIELVNLKPLDSGLKIIKLPKRFGQSTALACGFDKACADIAVTMDGDLQYSPEDIKSFWDAIQDDADLVCGWRRPAKGRKAGQRLPSRLANFLGKIIFRLDVHDFSCSFRAYRNDFYKDLAIPDGLHRFIPVFAKFKGKKIKEVEVSLAMRKCGKSKYNFLRFPGVIKDALLLKIAELFFNGAYQRLFKESRFMAEDTHD